MNPGELELFSTPDLVAELVRRTTFQGVVVHAVNGAKDPNWEGERLFSVHHNANLATEEVGRLLDVVGQFMVSGD